MPSPTLHVPAFRRADEYVGGWAMEPLAFHAFWLQVANTDLAAHMAAGPPRRPESLTELLPAKGGKSVAVISLLGTLMKQQSSFGGTSTVQVRRELRAMAADPNVSGILLQIDSPGGTVAGTDTLAADVRAARRHKPVWAQIEDLGASAAYWVASQADAVFAGSPTALVGSIGTVLTVYDQSAAAEREGVKAFVFATGPLKGAGTPGAEVTPEQQAYFQGLVDESQTHFDSAVRKGRGLTAAQLAAAKSGGVFPAGRAVEMRLVDGIRPLDETARALATQR